MRDERPIGRYPSLRIRPPFKVALGHEVIVSVELIDRHQGPALPFVPLVDDRSNLLCGTGAPDPVAAPVGVGWPQAKMTNGWASPDVQGHWARCMLIVKDIKNEVFTGPGPQVSDGANRRPRLGSHPSFRAKFKGAKLRHRCVMPRALKDDLFQSMHRDLDMIGVDIRFERGIIEEHD